MITASAHYLVPRNRDTFVPVAQPTVTDSGADDGEGLSLGRALGLLALGLTVAWALSDEPASPRVTRAAFGRVHTDDVTRADMFHLLETGQESR